MYTWSRWVLSADNSRTKRETIITLFNKTSSRCPPSDFSFFRFFSLPFYYWVPTGTSFLNEHEGFKIFPISPKTRPWTTSRRKWATGIAYRKLPKPAKLTFPRLYISNVKLASEINGIKEKVVPLGHFPTTKEILNDQHANEITPLFRTLGISGHDGPISSENLRTVFVLRNDIRVEGKLPLILNSDFFTMITKVKTRRTSRIKW